MMRTSELHRRPPRPRAKGEVLDGFRYVASLPVLWIPFAMLAAISLLSYNFTVTLPLFVTDSLHRNSSVFTILYSTFSFGAVVCALVVANRNLVAVRYIIFGAASLGVAMLLLSVVPGVGLAVPVVFLVGVTSILYMNATTSIVQVEAKPDMHGRVLALQTVLFGGSAALGGPLLGWLADSVGARSLFVLGGVVCLAAAAFGYLATQRVASNAPLFDTPRHHPSAAD
jgi:MFS family permease